MMHKDYFFFFGGGGGGGEIAHQPMITDSCTSSPSRTKHTVLAA